MHVDFPLRFSGILGAQNRRTCFLFSSISAFARWAAMLRAAADSHWEQDGEPEVTARDSSREAAMGDDATSVADDNADSDAKWVCQGTPRCVFGYKGNLTGNHARTTRGRRACLFCDRERLNAAFHDRKASADVRRQYSRLDEVQKGIALERVADAANRRWLSGGVPRRCAGNGQEECVFAQTPTQARARTHGKKTRCKFCKPRRLARSCATQHGRNKVKAALAHMCSKSRWKAIEERIPEEYRAEFRCRYARTSNGGRSCAMSKSWNMAKRQSAPQHCGGTWVRAIAFAEMDHVDILRPYPGETGSAFVRRAGARSDADLLHLPTMARRLTHLNSELANLPGRGVALLCASIHRAGLLSDDRHPETLQDWCEGSWFDSSCLEAVLSFFHSANGRRLLNAARHLDVIATEHPTEASTTDALEVLLGFLGSKKLLAELKRVNIFCAHMYTFSAHVLQGMALMADRQHWAEELAMQCRAMPVAVKHFICNPADDDALLNSLVASHRAHRVA